MTISQISTEIVALCQTSTQLRNVYGYAKTKPEGYPACTVTLADITGKFADTSRNQRSFVFSIRVMQERLNYGEDKAETLVQSIADELISIFDANYSLNGSCNFSKPYSAKGLYSVAPDVSVRVVEILLEAVVLQ